MEKGNYYVYTHTRVDNGQLFYVGIASKPKYAPYGRSYVFTQHGRNVEWWKMYAECDERIHVAVIFDDVTKEFASEVEQEIISRYGRFGIDVVGQLANRCLGGYRIGISPKRLAQYSRDGDFIKEWIGMSEAAAYYGVTIKAIWQSMNKKCLSCGSQWKFIEDGMEPIAKIDKYINHEVYQFDRDGNLIRSFISAKEAAESVGVDPSSIRHCILGNKKTIAGYKWSYRQSLAAS